MHIPSLLSLLGAAAVASAAKLTINIPPSASALLPNPAVLPPSTHAVLIGAPGTKFSAPLRRDNTFVFESLPESSYLLSIHSRDHFFPPYRVDIGHTEGDAAQEVVHAWQTFRGNEWSNKGPALGSAYGELRIDVRPAAQKDFYQSRGGFSVMSIFKNPMILMGLVSVVMIFGMPKLMENMDDETKKEFDEMQQSTFGGSEGALNQAQNFDLAGFLSGKPAGGSGGAMKKK